jgi:hypothetical protein
MDRRRVLTWAVALGLAGAFGTVARAGALSSSTPITFTGNVAADFSGGPANGVVSVAGEQPTDVAQAAWITQSGWINGWVMKGMDFKYDSATDTMYVGVQFYSIAGNADGNGTPGIPDPRLTAAGGLDEAHLGGQKSITVAFSPDVKSGNNNVAGTPVIVAGVPQDKAAAGTGIDGFTVSKYSANGGIETSYGAQLPGNTGALAFDPSAAHPDFEFTITNFSKIAGGLTGPNGFWVQAYAGSPEDVVAGEGHIGATHVLVPGNQSIPEPTTVLVWAMLAGGAGWQLRRSRRQANQA